METTTGLDALLARTEIAILAGVVLAAALVALARRFGRRRELPIYALVLFLAAIYYLLAAMGRSAPPARVGLEALGAVLFSVAAGYGALRRPILLAVGWLAHAAWDLVHYRRDAVVNRSLALWCLGLDVFLGGACVLLAIVG